MGVSGEARQASILNLQAIQRANLPCLTPWHAREHGLTRQDRAEFPAIPADADGVIFLSFRWLLSFGNFRSWLVCKLRVVDELLSWLIQVNTTKAGQCLCLVGMDMTHKEGSSLLPSSQLETTDPPSH